MTYIKAKIKKVTHGVRTCNIWLIVCLPYRKYPYHLITKHMRHIGLFLLFPHTLSLSKIIVSPTTFLSWAGYIHRHFWAGVHPSRFSFVWAGSSTFWSLRPWVRTYPAIFAHSVFEISILLGESVLCWSIMYVFQLLWRNLMLLFPGIYSGLKLIKCV